MIRSPEVKPHSSQMFSFSIHRIPTNTDSVLFSVLLDKTVGLKSIHLKDKCLQQYGDYTPLLVDSPSPSRM